MSWTEIREYLGSQEPFLLLSRDLWSKNLRPTKISFNNNELTFTYRFVSQTERNDLSATWSFSYDRIYFTKTIRDRMVSSRPAQPPMFLAEKEWIREVDRLEDGSFYHLKNPSIVLDFDRQIFDRF